MPRHVGVRGKMLAVGRRCGDFSAEHFPDAREQALGDNDERCSPDPHERCGVDCITDRPTEEATAVHHGSVDDAHWSGHQGC